MIRNLAQLEAFYWVARLGNFHAAAQRLALTQPTVSARLRALERRIGTPLIERTTQGAFPTSQGVAVLEYTERIMGLVSELEERLRPRRRLEGRLRFGVSDGFALVCLGNVMKAVRQDHPALELAVSIDNSRSLAARVQGRELDLAILSPSAVSAGLTIELLGYQEIAWIGGAELPFQTPLSPADLVAHRILTDPAPSHLFSVLVDWFAEVGVPPPKLATCDSVAVITALVVAGAGISVLPICLVKDALETGAVRRLVVQTPPRSQAIVAAYPRIADRAEIQPIVELIRRGARETGFLLSGGVS